MRVFSREVTRPTAIWAVIVCCCFLVSCRAPLANYLKPPTDALHAVKWAIIDPFANCLPPTTDALHTLKSAMIDPFADYLAPPAAALHTLKSAMIDPFGTAENVNIARLKAASALAEHRIRPATTVTGKQYLTLEDCRAVSLRNNLDLQVAGLEEMTKRAIEYSSKTKMLPNFLASAELSNRDNLPYTYSDSMNTTEGLPPDPMTNFPLPNTNIGQVGNWAMGHERSTWRYVLETNWSPTDAALAYYLTRSSINERLRAHYQRVRVAQKLLGVVGASYFRLLSLQEALPKGERLVAIRAEIAQSAEKLFDRQLMDVEDYHRHQRNLAKARNLQARLINDLHKQRNLLASALALSPDACVDGGFVVVGPLVAPTFAVQPCELEMIAVRNRPEAYQAGLNHLNSVNDYRRTIIKYSPRVSAFWRQTHDKDKYILNKDWRDVGVQMQFDFVQWVSNLSESSAAQSVVAKTESEIGTVAIAIASQVRTAALTYFDAVAELRRTKESLASARRVLRIMEQRFARDAIVKLTVDDTRADVLNEEVEYIRAVGEANATLGELDSAVGTNYNEPPP